MEKLIKCGQAGLCAFTAEVVAQRRYVGAFTAVAAAVVHAGGRDRLVSVDSAFTRHIFTLRIKCTQCLGLVSASDKCFHRFLCIFQNQY